jgi:hypothetical protein
MVMVMETKSNEYEDVSIGDSEIGDPMNPTSLTDEEIGTVNPDAPYISRDSGDGSKSREDEYTDKFDIQDEGDGRSDLRTYFDPRACEDTPVNYQRLYRLNQGIRVNDGNRKTKNRKADRRRDVKVVTSQLRMPENQREKVKEVIEGFDFNGIKFENILLATTSLVCNENGRNVREESKWDRIREGMGVEKDRVRYYRDKLIEETEWFGI